MDFLAMKSIKNHVFYGLVSNFVSNYSKTPLFYALLLDKTIKS